MANKTEKKQFESWEEVIVDFLNGKRNADEETYLKNVVKKVDKIFQENHYFNNNKIIFLFDSNKNKKKKDESPLKFQRNKACQVWRLRSAYPDVIEYEKLRKEYFEEIRKLVNKYNPKNWLSKNCNYALNVSFATHVAKLTHSKIDSPSIFDSINETKDYVLTTSSLKEKVIDGAVKGNQYAPIFQFLELELNGEKLAERLAKDDQLFNVFEIDTNLVSQWSEGFKEALRSKRIATHNLAKQIYFPVDCGYHLLSNIVSSSLAHRIFETIFDDFQKSATKAFDKKKYSDIERVVLPRRAQLSVTASNHNNASQLNGKRGGKLHLFSCQPPTWQSQLKPPIYRKSLFYDLYSSNINTEINYLRDFLLRFKSLGLSIKDPKRKRHLVRWVNNIIDEFLFYVGSIQALPAGWSDTEGIKLKKAHQYLLDPYRPDDTFQRKRQSVDWQSTVREDFARWLNVRLRGKDKQFTPQAEHTRMWKDLLADPLREYMERVDYEVKQHNKEGV